MAKKVEIEVFEVGELEPADGSLVVAWNENLNGIAHVLTWRAKPKPGAFVDFEMSRFPTHFFFLSEILSLPAVQEIRDLWDRRDGRTKRRILER
jgi:hypothetical protein